MRRGHRTAAGSGIVASVLSVSAFAQTDTAPRMLAFERSAVGIVREYLAADPTPADRPPELPPNFHAPAPYRPALDSMLRHSPSFRLQCRRIANAPFVTVRIRSAGGPLHGVRARTEIARQEAHRLDATIEIARLGNVVELIAHEIEHVIEQLDEIDLPARAGLAGSGVRLGTAREPTFETTRAIRVGLKVAEEVRRGGG